MKDAPMAFSKWIKLVLAFGSTLAYEGVQAEDGYRLWLRYDKVEDPVLLTSYLQKVSVIVVEGASDTEKVLGEELKTGLDGLLGRKTPLTETITEDGVVLVGTPSTSPLIASLKWSRDLKRLGNEGYLIRSTTLQEHKTIVIASASPVG